MATPDLEPLPEVHEPPTAADSRVRRWAWGAAILLFSGYLGFVAWYTSPHAAGADASGYLNSARLLREGCLNTELRLPPWGAEALPIGAIVPLGFTLDTTGQSLVPSYPIGQPLQLAMFIAMFGSDLGPAALNVSAMLGALLLLRAIAVRMGVKPGWALGLLVVWALSPLVFSYSLQVMSEMTSTFWVLASVYCALRTGERGVWALLAGMTVGMAVLVRPANLIIALPAAIALRPGLLRYTLFGLGGLPFAAFLAWYNTHQYGSAGATGYGAVGHLFLTDYLRPTLAHYAKWLPVQLTPLVMAAIAFPFLRIQIRLRIALVTWAGAFLGFYAFYYHTHETWWTLRLIVPGLPALALATTLVLQQVERPLFSIAFAGPHPHAQPRVWRRYAVGTMAVLFPLAVAWQIGWQRHFKVHHNELGDRVFPLMGRWISEHLAPDSLVMTGSSSGAIYHYTSCGVINFDQLGSANYGTLNELLSRHRVTLYAALLDHEEKRAFEQVPGSWERLAQLRHGAVWRRNGP